MDNSTITNNDSSKVRVIIEVPKADIQSILGKINSGDISESDTQVENRESTQVAEPKYLSTKETLKRLGVSRTTLWRYAKLGILVPRMVGRKLNRYAVSDIIKFEEGYNV